MLAGRPKPMGNESERCFWLLRLCQDERRLRSGTGLGAALRGDLERAECGIGTSPASGAWQCRTGGGRLALVLW